jgi:hypothetical protein
MGGAFFLQGTGLSTVDTLLENHEIGHQVGHRLSVDQRAIIVYSFWILLVSCVAVVLCIVYV